MLPPRVSYDCEEGDHDLCHGSGCSCPCHDEEDDIIFEDDDEDYEH